jgi:hypothetical protein
MKLISINENNEKTIELTVNEYEYLLVILDQAQLPEHRKKLCEVQVKLWQDLYDIDLE